LAYDPRTPEIAILRCIVSETCQVFVYPSGRNMSLKIKEGASPTAENPPTPPANPTPATAVEDVAAAVDETAGTNSAGETISIVSIHLSEVAKLTRDQGPIGRGCRDRLRVWRRRVRLHPLLNGQDVDDPSASSTSSIASSIRKYRELHGRTYHNFNTESSSEYWWVKSAMDKTSS